MKFLVNERLHRVRTEGLLEICGREFEVTYKYPDLKEEAKQAIKLVAEQVRDTPDVDISRDIHMTTGYWDLHFEDVSETVKAAFEMNPERTECVRGAEYAFRTASFQRVICHKYKAAYEPPTFNQMVVISDGVLEGLPLEGVRYPSPKHMSGWWLSTDLYETNPKMRPVHLHHVTAARPDVMKYLALPYCFRFICGRAEEYVPIGPRQLEGAWFDRTIDAEEHSQRTIEFEKRHSSTE